MFFEGVCNSLQADHAAKSLILLISACSKRLIEIFLVNPRVHTPVKPLDYQRGTPVKILNRHTKLQQSEMPGDPGTVLLIEARLGSTCSHIGHPQGVVPRTSFVGVPPSRAAVREQGELR